MPFAFSIIACPLIAFSLLLLFSTRMSKGVISALGVGGIALSCAATIAVWLATDHAAQQISLWEIFPAGVVFDTSLHFGFMIDSLSLTMALVVTVVSSLIALYSTEYMAHEEGFGRFFAAVNLFVAFMLVLVLADSLWLLFLGWEGVGLASYLLIGFFHKEPKAVLAAMKAFITTRIGDVFLLFGMLLCVKIFATVDIAMLADLSKAHAPDESSLITIACLCLLGGAVGKSAQLPLQTWLADAMWGPTPVSALIHAATMVTAGVYLLVRMSFLIVLSTTAQSAIMIVGLATLLMAGIAALYQTDMKRVLAYSTMSQIGYMFLAVGALAYQAAIFHLVTHAFFKALLFLSAGVIGHAVHHYDLTKMGGLRKSFPTVFIFFLIGGTSLMGLPFVSAGFFSKEWILNDIVAVPEIGTTLFYAASLGTFLTALYTARMIALTFFGDAKKALHDHAGLAMYGPLLVLAVFSVGIGWLQTPHFLGEVHRMSDFLASSVPTNPAHDSGLLWLIPTCLALLGGAIACMRYMSVRGIKAAKARNAWIHFARSGLGFDAFYMNVVVEPFKRAALFLEPDFVSSLYGQLVQNFQSFFEQMAKMHTGRLAHYVSFMMVAMVALASVMVLS